VVRGIFIGSFDPIHLGHVHLAVLAKEVGNLDEVLIVPAHVSPFKLDQPPVDGYHRLAMCRLAFEGWAPVSFSSVDIDRPSPTYTIDTVRELKSPSSKAMRLILGSEVARTLYQWKEAESLMTLSDPLVLELREGPHPRPWPDDAISQELKRRMVRVPQFEVSSTEVRHRLRKGLWCGHLVPRNVLSYIQQHQLYSSKEP
jgi:nicotinate-nucleotide adenylyltransferase